MIFTTEEILFLKNALFTLKNDGVEEHCRLATQLETKLRNEEQAAMLKKDGDDNMAFLVVEKKKADAYEWHDQFKLISEDNTQTNFLPAFKNKQDAFSYMMAYDYVGQDDIVVVGCKIR